MFEVRDDFWGLPWAVLPSAPLRLAFVLVLAFVAAFAV
jgi:hypothetical protein